MISVLRFRLADALELAEHAVAATAHADPAEGAPAGPALLLVADDGVYLMSNGLPQPPPGPNQPATSTVRAVFAEHVGHNQPRHHGDDLFIAVPLCQPGTRLIEQLRAAAGDDRTALVITVVDGRASLSTLNVPTPEARHAD